MHDGGKEAKLSSPLRRGYDISRAQVVIRQRRCPRGANSPLSFRAGHMRAHFMAGGKNLFTRATPGNLGPR